MEEIPTAQEFLDRFTFLGKEAIGLGVVGALKDFARLHCEAQAKAIAENVKLKADEDQDFRLQRCCCVDYIVDKESILNAYPNTNIK